MAGRDIEVGPAPGDRLATGGADAEADGGTDAGAGRLAAGSARARLTTILGEFVYAEDRPVWTSTLLYLLTGSGIEPQTARQAVARTAAAGWISGERVGRETRWSLTPSGRAVIAEGRERILSMGDPPPAWDGRWLILQITIPGSRRAVRATLYGALSWAGFGNPTPGVWLAPHAGREREVARIVRDLGLADTSLSFVGRSASIGLSDAELVARSWDLELVAGHYARLVDHYARLMDHFAGRRPEPGDATLFAHVDLITSWQRFPFLDPQLPEELLPDWIGRRASALFARLRTEWYDEATRRWRELGAAAG